MSPSTTNAAALKHDRSEEHTSELQSHSDLVCRLLLEKKKKTQLTGSRACIATGSAITSGMVYMLTEWKAIAGTLACVTVLRWTLSRPLAWLALHTRCT